MTENQTELEESMAPAVSPEDGTVPAGAADEAHDAEYAREHWKIRSFVRREGRITPSQEKALTELFPVYGIEYSKERVLDFKELFGNSNDVVLEIGFGMGSSILEMAEKSPDVNFLGIEVHRPGVGVCLREMKKRGIENLRVMSDDAVDIMTDMIPDGSLSRIQLFFPDPWQKKKHHKRRIVQPSFITLAANKLKSGGILHLATDWESYAEEMLEVIGQSQDFQNLASDGRFIEPRPDRPVTKFEQRGIRLGHVIHDLMYRRA